MRPLAVHDVAEHAAAAAARAAARAGVDIVPVVEAEDAHRVTRLLSDIWATADQPIVPAEVIRSLAPINGYAAMAVIAGEPVGAALGFLGCDERRRDPRCPVGPRAAIAGRPRDRGPPTERSVPTEPGCLPLRRAGRRGRPAL